MRNGLATGRVTEFRLEYELFQKHIVRTVRTYDNLFSVLYRNLVPVLRFLKIVICTPTNGPCIRIVDTHH